MSFNRLYFETHVVYAHRFSLFTSEYVLLLKITCQVNSVWRSLGIWYWVFVLFINETVVYIENLCSDICSAVECSEACVYVCRLNMLEHLSAFHERIVRKLQSGICLCLYRLRERDDWKIIWIHATDLFWDDKAGIVISTDDQHVGHFEGSVTISMSKQSTFLMCRPVQSTPAGARSGKSHNTKRGSTAPFFLCSS
jgi:hypothetical protein